ncbi:MAG: carbon starvation CstA family protein [Candidatus Omnitrophota bacterium]
MNILLLITSGIILLLLGYFLYGAVLTKLFHLQPGCETPAHRFKNTLDFVPTEKTYLLGQHLSAIAAAGPIVGPILAGIWFGWLPAFLWIIIGGIFIGGVHDLASLAASLRHEGKSIAEVIRENMSKRAFILFLLFLWFSLIYVITAFTDITAGTFVAADKGESVASSSMMYLLLALVMGIVIKIFKPRLFLATVVFVPFIFVCIYLGPIFPLKIAPLFGMDMRMTWDILLLVYCFFAAVIPVWLLLQPRGYLGGFFLVFTVGISFVGIIIGSFTRQWTIQYPAFVGWVSPQGFPLLPLLFTTVACGACSGFHAIVCSGTTSKQLSKETDAKLIGYGGMLLESFVALIALATLLLLNSGQIQQLKDPNLIYANGIAAFLGCLGINKEFALNFALLAFATFVYDTLDVGTRLGRYIFEELTGWRSKLTHYVSALATLILPAIFVTRKVTDVHGNVLPAWKVFWTIFGSSNQLLAAMVLFGVSVWLFKNRMRYLITLLPAIFMMFVAMFSLYLTLRPSFSNMILQGKFYFEPLVITGLVLSLLAFLLVFEGIRVFLQGKR